ncbi:Methylcrotonoyl-CoA carboxylase subunit alpha, mitochondrial [Geranomyces variabilis]|uniref:Methylcrotonoyl-CoA carboxylase subunit alpha, mitochondrial n=1 Tax=Geranomyces variabilis TaxID=109894 RepID=A0AAD5XSM2_9FUNG|nr:Methylcrotonoyl-CoA carboxylase subunit alpha, mitochondrial [Geranomyces variabilis]
MSRWSGCSVCSHEKLIAASFTLAASTALAAEVPLTERKPMFTKLLIANRGEIACRIIRTAKKLGVRTVAVYSEADRNALHVRLADEAILIGPAPSAESYLKMDTIIEVAKRVGAQAIHPGYGFLSENATFAERVQQAGVAFVGPPAQAIIDMGSKSASKIIMENAGVPCVPGYHGEDQAPETLAREADRIGYPVLIKAIKGGGGKGMRIVFTPDEFVPMLDSAKRESMKSFGDDAVLVEKYLVRPRHVEVQVFADKMGNAVYLFERDCSVQRRHQKVLEEAPAPGLSEELRRDLGEKAVAAAKAVNYVGAGTVEFILDTDDQKFYFMEMNTRLQVEHPITEMITSTDLVEWQLQVAAGNPLPKLQHELAKKGHAFEARIYAENPRNNFLPDTGRLAYLDTPAESDVLRVETGVRMGDEVSVYYVDPMISKLVVGGRDRDEALRALRNALAEFQVAGLHTNIEFLKALAAHPAFIAADVETGFIPKYEKDLLPPRPETAFVTFAQAAVGALLKSSAVDGAFGEADPWASLAGFRVNSAPTRIVKLVDDDGKSVSVSVTLDAAEKNLFKVTVESAGATPVSHAVRLLKNDAARPAVVTRDATIQHHTRLEVDGTISTATVIHTPAGIQVRPTGGAPHSFTLPASPAAGANSGSGAAAATVIKAPMPCKIAQLAVQVGDKLKKGQTVLMVEAMKMEHVIKAPFDGAVVKRVVAKLGDVVAEGATLVVFEDPAVAKE